MLIVPGSPLLHSRTESRLLLLFTRLHSVTLRPLSLNITREVCAYLGPHAFLASIAINQRLVTVFDLETGFRSQVAVKQEFLPCITYCSVDEFSLLVVGNKYMSDLVQRVSLLTGDITAEAPMLEGRIWPGMVVTGDFCYVFGGNPQNALTSAEKLHMATHRWVQVPPMPTPKMSFTPCAHGSEVFLPFTNSSELPVEVFSTDSEQYRLLPLLLSVKCFGTVTTIVAGELVHLLTYSEEVGRWRVDSREAEMVMRHTAGGVMNRATNSTPVKRGAFVYWASLDGGLGMFDLREIGLATDVPIKE